VVDCLSVQFNKALLIQLNTQEDATFHTRFSQADGHCSFHRSDCSFLRSSHSHSTESVQFNIQEICFILLHDSHLQTGLLRAVVLTRKSARLPVFPSPLFPGHGNGFCATTLHLWSFNAPQTSFDFENRSRTASTIEGTHIEDACGCLPDVVLAVNHAYKHQGQHSLQVTLKEAAAGGDSDDIRKRGKGGIGDLQEKTRLKKLVHHCSACCHSLQAFG
jgi:hypothetical protein